MKLITFTTDNHTRIGSVLDDRVIDLSAAAPALPTDMKSFLAAGADALGAANKAQSDSAATIPLAEVKLEAPILNPGKMLAIGLNYADHVEESGMEMPKHQIWFNKQWNAVNGPGADVDIPAVAPGFIDYEAELCFVIGRTCRHVPRERAEEVIAGYTCGNDVSVRDWQLRTPQFTIGKSFQTHGPIGPWIVTADEFGDPHAKDIACFINDEQRQNSNTKHLIFDCFDQIAELSAAFTLNPGDVIFSGTPSGVGGAMKPSQFLKHGDVMRIEIEGIGALINTCADKPAVTFIA
jgi:2-keto-4-pentenoate hydratase/2-oxohepta-3-ene-1,7-dioic acid hydratase in catechol pathway